MKRLKIYIYLILPLFAAFSFCTEKSNHKRKAGLKLNSKATNNNELPSNQNMRFKNTSTWKAIKRERANDSIILIARTSFILNSDINSIYALDSLAKISDGSLTTNIDYSSTQLFYKNFKGFIKFLSSHPKSNILSSFLNGMSEELSVYRGQERESKIQELKNWVKIKSKESGLNNSETKFANSLLDRIDPSIYD